MAMEYKYEYEDGTLSALGGAEGIALVAAEEARLISNLVKEARELLSKVEVAVKAVA